MDTTTPAASENIAALALDLADRARAVGTLLYVDPTGDRLDRLADAAAAFAPELEVLCFPATDVLPYDRTVASGRITGRRVATMVRIAAAPDSPRLVITSARAVLARVPPAVRWVSARCVAA